MYVHTYLIEVRGTSFELSCHHQYCFESSQAKIVVVLSRELLLSQFVEYCHLLG